MMRKTIAAFALIAGLAGTMIAPATASAAETRRAESRRVYDRDHQDYHRWDAAENRAYRKYLAERNRRYRHFRNLRQDEQRDYWRWRHER